MSFKAIARVALALVISSAAIAVQAPVVAQAAAPKVLVAPSIPLAATAGDKVVVTPAKLNASAKVSFQWYLAKKAIKKATKTSVTITQAQVGKALYALETIKFKTGKVVTVKSNTVTIGRVSAAKPTIAFTDQTQTQITATAVAALPADSTVTYSWAIDGKTVENAVASTFTVSPSQEGHSVSVTATYNRTGYTATSYTSLGLMVPAKGAPTVQLLWSENFDSAAGSSVDSSIWTTEIGDGTSGFAGSGWGNNEREYYTADAARMDGNGNLVITANRIVGPTDMKCSRTACDFTSARIQTQNKVGFKYGRLEARVKVTGGQGVWPAFWTLGANLSKEIAWPRCGEIDIAEWSGSDMNNVRGTLHLPHFQGGGGITTLTPLSSPATEWHTYSVDWAPNQVSWYVDGKLYQSVIQDQTAPSLWPFNSEQFVLLNLAMGGNFVGNSIDPNLNSATMTVDYVKYYSVNGVGELIQH